MEIEGTFPVTFRKCFMFCFFLMITSDIPALKSQTFFRNTFFSLASQEKMEEITEKKTKKVKYFEKMGLGVWELILRYL